MIEIKKLPSERWQDYRKLRLEALQNDPVAFGSSYEEEISRPEEFWRNRIGSMLFAVENDRPIGMVRYAFETRVKNKHVAGIYAMCVNREFRNRGIGKRLMDGVISLIAENKDIRKIRLAVTPEQHYALKLYEACGFKRAGIFKDELYNDGRYYDEVPMEKFI
jgi:ribosomal protein S18 acetylase RimI-like enzyme